MGYAAAAVIVAGLLSDGLRQQRRRRAARSSTPTRHQAVVPGDDPGRSGPTSGSRASPRCWCWSSACWSRSCGCCRAGPAPRCVPIALVYCDVFRAIPAIVVILLIVFGTPLRDSSATQVATGLARHHRAVADLLGVRRPRSTAPGLASIHPSQSAAARSLGLSYTQTLRTVLVPQAVRRVIPPLLNDFISLQKDTALLSIGGIAEVVLIAKLWETPAVQPVAGHAGGRVPVHHHHDPAGAVRRLPDRPRRRATGRQLMAFLEIDEEKSIPHRLPVPDGPAATIRHPPDSPEATRSGRCRWDRRRPALWLIYAGVGKNAGPNMLLQLSSWYGNVICCW